MRHEGHQFQITERNEWKLINLYVFNGFDALISALQKNSNRYSDAGTVNCLSSDKQQEAGIII